MHALPEAFAPMAAREQFVTWYATPHPTKPGKFDKIPTRWWAPALDDTSQGNAHNPRNWTSAAQALAAAPSHDRGWGSGIGFVFTADDPFYFLDIDGALVDGAWSSLSVSLLAQFPGAAVEVSHSGTGLHVIGTAHPAPQHGTRNTPLHLELYTSGRFVALTGHHARGSAAADGTLALHTVAAQYFPPSAVTVTPGNWTDEPVAEWCGPTDDDELLRRAMAAAARSAAGVFGGQTFADLWQGDVPDDTRSEADQALAGHLAYWTGKDCERMERLMRASGLVRDKWDSASHAGYLRNTILKACAFREAVCIDAPAATPQTVSSDPAEPSRGAAIRARVGSEYLTPYDQQTYFSDCIFISDQKRVYSTRRNKLMDRETFDVEYGGRLFSLSIDGKSQTDSAWTGLTRNRVNSTPMVDDLCFRPAHAPGEVLSSNGRSLVNTYRPYQCVSVPGDASRWVEHVQRMLPNGRDAEILIEWCARITQRPGVKVPWWPVLQGVKGNGKGLVAVTLEYIAGEEYSHRPNTAALAKDGMKFNKWLSRKTFVFLDEVSLSHKRDFLEELKAIVTESRIPFEPKGQDATMGDNAANGLVATNHTDGMPAEVGERRYAYLYCAQQHPDDLIRDGMTEAYFYDFRGWLLGIDGHAGAVPGAAHVAHYLQTYALPAVLPYRGPETTSTARAIAASMGRIEQEITEAIAEGRPGFCGGWVSGMYLNALIDAQRGAHVARNKRRAMMQALGYDWHPALAEGRPNNPVTPDNAKSVLYCRTDHPARQLATAQGAAEAYSKAQAQGGATGAFGAVVPIR